MSDKTVTQLFPGATDENPLPAPKAKVGTNRSKRVSDMPRRDGFYRLVVDGEERKFPSVTTIMRVLNKPALVNWAAKTAATLVLDDPFTYNTAEKAASGIYGVRDSAADRGSTVHSIAESLLHGGEIDIDNIPEQFRGYGRAVKSFLDLHKPEPLFIEVNVYSTVHGYAGTCDLICRMAGDVWMLDWKTSKGGAIYPEVGLQLRAYREADLILVRHPELKTLPMGTVERTGGIGLSEDGTFTFKEVDAPLDAFLAVKRVYEWTTGDR